jgi:ribose 5-phosphate isomerase A
MSGSGRDVEKFRSAEEAVKLVEDGMVIGIGTGTTVEHFLNQLGKRIREEELEIWGVPSSYHSHILAIENGIVPVDLFQFEELDICFDGADQVDSELNCVKGRGGALLREKIIAQASDKVVIIVDSSKIVEKLSTSVPVEFNPFAYGNVRRLLRKLNGSPQLRMAKTKIGPCISDNGNMIFDVDFGVIENPSELELKINSIAGVVENGIFPEGLIDVVVVGYSDSAKVLKR